MAHQGVICFGLKNAQTLMGILDKAEDARIPLTKEEKEIKDRVIQFLTDVRIGRKPVVNKYKAGGRS